MKQRTLASREPKRKPINCGCHCHIRHLCRVDVGKKCVECGWVGNRHKVKSC